MIYRVIAFRPQDQQNIERSVTLQGNGMDFARVRRIIGKFAEALDEPVRSVPFEAPSKQLGQ